MRVRLFGQYFHVPILLLAALEFVLLYAVLIAGAWLRFDFDLGRIHRYEGALWPRALLFAAAMWASLLAFGLYSSRQRARRVGTTVRVAAAVLGGVGISAVALFFISHLWIGRGVLGVAAVGAFVLLIATRVVFARMFDESAFKRRVLVYGAGRNAQPMAMLRRRSDQRGFTLVGFVQAEGEELHIPAERLLPPDGELLGICVRHAIDEVVVAMEDRRRHFPLRELLDCRLAGIDVTELLTFLERETGRVRIDVLNPSWLIFGTGFKRNSFRLFTARLLDLIASSVILAFGSPLMLLTVIAIKLEEGWRAPVFYRQERVGFAGRTFELLKFRSMRVDAESGGRAQWACRNDPRVTRVGSIIRKLRIDELPQIINVLRGEMGFVGPRPERPQFVEQLAQLIPYYVERHSVKPGITGWAQLCYQYGSSEQDALEKLQYDLYYIKNNSLLFDLAILLQTAEVVMMGKGAR